ncbi:hypothetical protein TNCV_4936961 [Trichonephila clavipes]|nr:hypothetical protein TNCV_4936961 [Trichonephila clavipes]
MRKADKECQKHRLRVQQSNMQPDLRKLICEHIIRVLQHQKDVNQKQHICVKHDFVPSNKPWIKNWGRLPDKCLYEQFDDVCSSMNFEFRDHACSYSCSCITDRRVFNSVIYDESGRTNGDMSFFQIKLGSAYSITMVTSFFCGIVVNAQWQCAFTIVILAHHLA